MLGRVDKIGKGVEFVMHAPGVVPGFAEFTAAADVGNSEGHAAVEKAEAIRIEGHWHGDAVATVAVQKKRGRGIARGVAAIDNGQRNARAVLRGGVETLAD